MRTSVTVAVETEFGNECEIKFQMFPDRVLLHLEGVPDLVEYVVLDEDGMESLYRMLSAVMRAREAPNGNG